MPEGAAGSERAEAWCVDSRKVAGYHCERPRGREVSTGCAVHAGNDGGASEAKEKREIPCDELWASVVTVPFEPLGRLGEKGTQAIEAIATDAAMMRGDRTAAPAIAQRIRHALECTLVAGVTVPLATAAGGSGKLTWERSANLLLGRLAQKSEEASCGGSKG